MPCPLCDPTAPRPHAPCDEHARDLVDVIADDELSHAGTRFRITLAGVETSRAGSVVWTLLARPDVDVLPESVRAWLRAKGMR